MTLIDRLQASTTRKNYILTQPQTIEAIAEYIRNVRSVYGGTPLLYDPPQELLEILRGMGINYQVAEKLETVLKTIVANSKLPVMGFADHSLDIYVFSPRPIDILFATNRVLRGGRIRAFIPESEAPHIVSTHRPRFIDVLTYPRTIRATQRCVKRDEKNLYSPLINVTELLILHPVYVGWGMGVGTMCGMDTNDARSRLALILAHRLRDKLHIVDKSAKRMENGVKTWLRKYGVAICECPPQRRNGDAIHLGSDGDIDIEKYRYPEFELRYTPDTTLEEVERYIGGLGLGRETTTRILWATYTANYYLDGRL